MSDKFEGLITRFHAFYPTGFVVSVFTDRRNADKALTALESDGFSDVRVLSPMELLERANADQAKWNRLDEFVNNASDAASVALRYLQLAQAGETLLLVKAQDAAAQAIDLLKQHQGHTLYQYNRFTFQPVD